MMLFQLGTACAHCEWSKVPFAAQDLSSCDNLNSFWQLHNVKWAGAKLIVAPPAPRRNGNVNGGKWWKAFANDWSALIGNSCSAQRRHSGRITVRRPWRTIHCDTCYQCRRRQGDTHTHKHTHTHRERDTDNTQTCGEHLKGLNKLFISGVGFWRRQNAMAGGREKKRERGDRVGKRGNSQANICEKPPNSSRGAGTWNVLNATLRVTFAECECHFACCSFHSPTLATLLYAVLSLPLSLCLVHTCCVSFWLDTLKICFFISFSTAQPVTVHLGKRNDSWHM